MLKAVIGGLVALVLVGCGTTSSMVETPLGTVASVEINGPSGSREITCIGKVVRGVFVYNIKNCQTSTRQSVGHTIAAVFFGSVVPATIHGTAIVGSARMLARSEGDTFFVGSPIAVSQSGANAQAGAHAAITPK